VEFLPDSWHVMHSESGDTISPGTTHVKRELIERALGAELSEHLGYEKGDPAGRGSSSKTILRQDGEIEIAVSRDPAGSFEQARRGSRPVDRADKGAKFWLKVVNELKACGLNDILVAVVDGGSRAFGRRSPRCFRRPWCRPASSPA
jgi:transposase-like protein